MPEREKFDLGDYVEVKDRIRVFYEFYAGGRLVTEEVRATTEPDGKPRVWVKAAAYRTADDPHPGIGWSWLELPGITPYTKGSELENAETSAWGRAIAALGVLIDAHVGSANEARTKAEAKTEERPARAPQRPAAAPKPAAPAPVAARPAQAANEPPAVSNDELDSLVRTNTATLRPKPGEVMDVMELQRRAAAAKIPLSELNRQSHARFDGTIAAINDEQRFLLAAEVGLA